MLKRAHQMDDTLPAAARPAELARRLGAAALFAVALAACNGEGGESSSADPAATDPVADAPNESNDRLEITNDQATLDARVLDTEVDVPVDAPGDAATQGGTTQGKPATAMRKPASVTLTLTKEIQPPQVEGQTVQATSISQAAGNVAVVSYNMRGEPYLGAIDWVSQLNSNRPLLSSGVTFNDADVNAVAADGNYVYMALATSAPEFAYPAVVERLRVSGNRVRLDGNERRPLVSFAATSVLAAGGHVYATSGNVGGVYALAGTDLAELGAFPLHDARWVAWDEAGRRIVVAQGTPGQLSVFAAGSFPGGSLDLQNTFPFPGADVPESKSTVEVSGGKAFIAAGTEGVQVMCLDTGEIIGSVPRPDPVSLGLDPAVVVTNAVTVDRDLMFISNGEAGVYVARADRRFEDSGCAPQNIEVEGKLRFEALQSANHVSFKGDYLFVAAGLGGVKVVRVRDR